MKKQNECSEMSDQNRKGRHCVAPVRRALVCSLVATCVFFSLGVSVATAELNITNTAPVLGPIVDQTVNEQTELTFTAVGTDQDLPAQTLTYSLEEVEDNDFPEGAIIDSASGVFSWTPAYEDGGFTYLVDVVVTDNGTNPPALSARQAVSITVMEVSDVFELLPISDQIISEDESLFFTADVNDPDEMAETLVFSLDAASVAAGMVIDPEEGDFDWEPTEEQGGATYTVTVTVTANGPEIDSVTFSQTFTITVVKAHYVITYDANNATSGGAPEAQEKTRGVDLALQFNTNHLARTDYTFDGWSTDPGGLGDNYDEGEVYEDDESVTFYANWAVETFALSVSSAHGRPLPQVGDHDYDLSSTVTCLVYPPAEEETFRYSCIGWVGTGCVPASGNASSVSFVITNDSTLAWQWGIDYRLTAEVEASGLGSVTTSSEWVASGSEATVTAVPGDGHCFGTWLVDGVEAESVVIDGTHTVKVTMDAAHRVEAVFVELSLSEALDNDVLVWTTGGDANWIGQTRVTFDGVDAAGSGFVTNNGSCWLETTLRSSGTLSFQWRASCKDRYDFLTFKVDGEFKKFLTGERDWEHVEIFVEPGEHTFRWTYAKGEHGSEGEDRGWVDHVVWEPGVPGAEWTLEIADSVGDPIPAVGAHTYTNGQSVAVSVTSPVIVTAAAEQRICKGWQSTGLLPASGTGAEASLIMTTHAELVWNWGTQYWLSAESVGGTVDVSGWIDAGEDVVVTVVTDPGYSFTGWSGDLEGATVSGTSVSFTMDGPRMLVPCFMGLADVFGTTNLVWETTGSVPWVPQNEVSADEGGSGESGAIGDRGWSKVKTTVTGPGTLTFTWRVSSEANCDWLDFNLAGMQNAVLTGESGWKTVSVPIGEGDHVLEWEYWKDEAVAEGSDRGWLDQVVWTPDTPASTGFTLWLSDLGLTGDPQELFREDRGDGVAYGFEYAFGNNLPADGVLLNIRFVNGRPVVETPAQDKATLADVDLRIVGTDDLTSGLWLLSIVPVMDNADKPINRDWNEPAGPLPEKAFFKLKATLK